MANEKPKAENKAKGGKGKEGKKGKGGGKFVLVMILAGALLPFGLPTVLVCLGLLPTLVALLTDTDEHRSTTATIGFLNIAGVFPFLLDLWLRGQTMEAALAIVKQPTNWLIMLGSAAAGQLLLYAIPPAMAMLTITQYETRVKSLKEAQEELKKIWGPDVMNVTGLDEVRKRNGG
jgi:hypothetical protein